MRTGGAYNVVVKFVATLSSTLWTSTAVVSQGTSFALSGIKLLTWNTCIHRRSSRDALLYAYYKEASFDLVRHFYKEYIHMYSEYGDGLRSLDYN